MKVYSCRRLRHCLRALQCVAVCVAACIEVCVAMYVAVCITACVSSLHRNVCVSDSLQTFI